MRPPSDHPKAPSLEALLRLKRAEKPDARFWDDFERGMRQRQLASIVEPKPWWLGISLFVRRSSPVMSGVAAGALAMLAVLIARVDFAGNSPSGLALRQTAPENVNAPRSVQNSRDAAGNDLLVTSKPDTETPSGSSAASPSEHASPITVVSLAAPAPTDTVPASDRTAGDPEFAPDITTVHASSNQSTESDRLATDTRETEGSTSPASGIELVVASVTDPTLTAENTGFWPETARQMIVENDARAIPAGNDRNARLLANVEDPDSTPSPKALANVRDRILHRMNDGEELYASISRLGVSGDRLSLKF